MSKANDAEKIRTLSKIDLNLLTIFCLIYSWVAFPESLTC